MSIKVNTYQLQIVAEYAFSNALLLEEKAREINTIYNNLDLKVKSRDGIGNTIHVLKNRIEAAQQKLYNISSFLSNASKKYNEAETIITAKSACIGLAHSANANSAIIGSTTVGALAGAAVTVAIQGRAESRKWYQKNWFKLAVGAVVVGGAIAAAVTVGGPILVGIAVGAAIGAAIGGITGGIVSKINKGSFVDGLADGIMWGAIGGAISGGVGATGIGVFGAAAVEGSVNSAIYVGQTLQNDGNVTFVGLTSSFVTGAGFSALGNVVSNKISKMFGRNVSNNVDDVMNTTMDVGIRGVSKYINIDEISPLLKT